jgi:hypothetical protein
MNKLEKHVLYGIKLQIYAVVHLLCRLLDDTVDTASGDETKDMVRLYNRLNDAIEFMDRQFGLEEKCATDK